MKKEWSPKWSGSRQPRKQRKYRHNAPLHIRRKFLSSHLSKELRERFGKRSVPVRKGDEVLVMTGSFRGIRGNVERVDLGRTRVYVESVKRKKVDGSEVTVPLHPSNVMITKLALEDKARQAVFERSGKSQAPQKEKASKPKAAAKKAKPQSEGKVSQEKEEGHVKKPEHNHAVKHVENPNGKPHGEEKDW
jgi:large subunit ribosomal protein L24